VSSSYAFQAKDVISFTASSYSFTASLSNAQELLSHNLSKSSHNSSFNLLITSFLSFTASAVSSALQLNLFFTLLNNLSTSALAHSKLNAAEKSTFPVLKKFVTNFAIPHKAPFAVWNIILKLHTAISAKAPKVFQTELSVFINCIFRYVPNHLQALVVCHNFILSFSNSFVNFCTLASAVLDCLSKASRKALLSPVISLNISAYCSEREFNKDNTQTNASFLPNSLDNTSVVFAHSIQFSASLSHKSAINQDNHFASKAVAENSNHNFLATAIDCGVCLATAVSIPPTCVYASLALNQEVVSAVVAAKKSLKSTFKDCTNAETLPKPCDNSDIVVLPFFTAKKNEEAITSAVYH